MGLLDKLLKPSKQQEKSLGYGEICQPKHTFITSDYGTPFVYKAWEFPTEVSDTSFLLRINL